METGEVQDPALEPGWWDSVANAVSFSWDGFWGGVGQFFAAWDVSAWVSAVAALASFAGAWVAWALHPSARFVLSHVLADEERWMKDGDPVSAYCYVVNHGTGAAHSVTLHVRQPHHKDEAMRQWVRTNANDYFPTVEPSEAVKFGHWPLRQTHKGPKGKALNDGFMEGRGGYVYFDGIRVRVKWRGKLGFPRRRTFNLQRSAAKLGLAYGNFRAINDEPLKPNVEPTLVEIRRPGFQREI